MQLRCCLINGAIGPEIDWCDLENIAGARPVRRGRQPPLVHWKLCIAMQVHAPQPRPWMLAPPQSCLPDGSFSWSLWPCHLDRRVRRRRRRRRSGCPIGLAGHECGAGQSWGVGGINAGECHSQGRACRPLGVVFVLFRWHLSEQLRYPFYDTRSLPEMKVVPVGENLVVKRLAADPTSQGRDFAAGDVARIAPGRTRALGG